MYAMLRSPFGRFDVVYEDVSGILCKESVAARKVASYLTAVT